MNEVIKSLFEKLFEKPLKKQEKQNKSFELEREPQWKRSLKEQIISIAFERFWRKLKEGRITYEVDKIETEKLSFSFETYIVISVRVFGRMYNILSKEERDIIQKAFQESFDRLPYFRVMLHFCDENEVEEQYCKRKFESDEVNTFFYLVVMKSAI